jgi:phosphate transport system protein
VSTYVSPRVQFVHQLEEIRDAVLTMGSMVDKAIDGAMDGLRRRDMALAERVIKDDRLINRRRYDIEQSALLLIATQQPMASDLRFLAAVLHITTDLERMGDHARSVARLTLKLGREAPLKPLIDLPRMADLCRGRLRRALDALVARDAEAAQEIAAQDSETDALQDAVYKELLEMMLADPSTVSRATYLLWIAHNLERVGDHVTNVCERVIFTVTGQLGEADLAREEP